MSGPGFTRTVAVTLMVCIAAFAQTASSPADVDDDVKQCMQHCRTTFTSIEQTLRLINQVQKATDPAQERDALVRMRAQLIEMKEQMSRCMVRLERLEEGKASGPQVAAVVGRMWACPMHMQVRQDKPGNCPICDATLRPVRDATTQPAVALAPEPAGEEGSPGEQHGTAGR